MAHAKEKTIKTLGRHIALILLMGLLLVCMAGCHSSDESSGSSAIPKPTVQSKAQAVSDVQNNPNIPPEAKAHIAAQIQGTAPPPVASGTEKP